MVKYEKSFLSPSVQFKIRYIDLRYRFLERHILKALWRFTILKINNLTNQKTIKSLSKKKGLETPFECV